MTIEELTEEEVDLLRFFKHKDLGKDDVQKIFKGLSKGKPDEKREYKLPFNAKRLKFVEFTDSHIGHINYRYDVMEHLIKYSKRQGCEFVVCAGDILEGMSGRDGHVYELHPEHGLGASAQLDYCVEQLSGFDIPIYAITASSSHDGWFESKGNTGLVVGEELERRVDNFKFLGKDEQDIVCDNGMIIRLLHPGGGSAYALSYKLQKHINAIQPGKKPHILIQGHYHKAVQMFYRNIHAFEGGCLEDQTAFMRKMHTPAMVGYYIIDTVFDKKKNMVDKIRTEFVPFY
jgi:predicted phosphodiesterase